MHPAVRISAQIQAKRQLLLHHDAWTLCAWLVGLLNRLVDKVLNAPESSRRVDKEARLDVLRIMANCCKSDSVFSKGKIQKVLAGVSSWFEKFCETQRESEKSDPELHKAMLLLLARAFDYKLKTEDVLELTSGDRKLALESVIGILEDGEIVVTEVKLCTNPTVGQRGQWEQREASIRYEKALVLQMCQLLLGFTRADTYFSSLEEGFYFMEAGLELPEYCIEAFSVEVDHLLAVTKKSKLVEKLAIALNHELFSSGKVLEAEDHEAMSAVHGFLQNLYLYGCEDTDEFRHYLLADTLLVPHVVIPYLVSHKPARSACSTQPFCTDLRRAS